MSETVILTPDSPWRGCSAKFSQPLTVKDQSEARNLAVSVSTHNFSEVVYRTGDGETDVCRHVFRWDIAPYKEVFQGGLRVSRQRFSPDETFYSLDKYVDGGGSRPLDSRKESSFAFLSTTVSNSWYPPVPSDRNNPKTLQVYRYEIYAPGGIWVSATLGSNYPKRAPRHDEVVFVGGVAPQYIRSAQAFTLTGSPDGSTILERGSNMLLINGNFNPQSHPLRFLKIESPVCDYTDRQPLVQRVTNKSETSEPNIIKWYATDVADRDLYLSAAFRTSRNNEAYYILQNMVTQLYYDPGGTNDHIVNGPSFVCQMFKSLEYTPFGEHGIDAAFQLQGDEAIIFTANLCVRIDYAPSAPNDKILSGPTTIPEMIPLLKGTVFESGLDSAFESKLEYEYFLTKGNVCAHISYDPETKEFELVKIGQIAQIIPILKGKMFENGIDAAYGSHAQNEVAYLFQSNNWAILQVNLEERKDDIYGPFVMGSDAGVIAEFAPTKNRGLDMREDAGAQPTNPEDYDHDQVVEPSSHGSNQQGCSGGGRPSHGSNQSQGSSGGGRPSHGSNQSQGCSGGGRPSHGSSWGCQDDDSSWGGPPSHGSSWGCDDDDSSWGRPNRGPPPCHGRGPWW